MSKKDYKKASKHLIKGKEVKLNSAQNHAENRLYGDSKFIEAEIDRRTGNFEKAIVNYKVASDYLTQYSKYLYGNFLARKGLLMCYLKVDQKELLEEELDNVLSIYERNRKNLNEEKSRNSYFHNEQTIYDIAIEFYLNKDETVKAFNYSEDSKARSLLDFIKNGAEIRKDDLNYQNVAKPLRLTEIQERMPDNTQVVQYAILSEKIVIWVISKSTVEVVIKDYSSIKLNDSVIEYLKILKENRAEDVFSTRSIASDLYEVLITPIVQKLEKEKDLFIVSDKFLHKLPFSSLFNVDTEKYLVEDYTITNSPSSTIFILKSEDAINKNKTENLLSFGNPTFDRKENPHLNNLKQAREEAEVISNLYRNNKTFVEENATKINFVNNFADAEVVHFAGHYVANEDQPLNSKLLMAKTNSQEENDLRVLEIAKIRNSKIKLVVLSACQTDVETYVFGEGAIGATRMFLGVGSPIVVASYFEVDSKVTSELMKKFHKYRRKNGLTVAKSLQKVQIEAINNTDSLITPPYYWSAFSPTGGYTDY